MSTRAVMTLEELRAAVLAADDITIEPVATPEWPTVDGYIHVRLMAGRHRERYLDSIRQVEGQGRDMRVTVKLEDTGAKLAAATMCDASGTLVFRPNDVQALGEKSYVALQRVIDVAARLNGLDDQAVDAAKNASASGTVSVGSNTV